MDYPDTPGTANFKKKEGGRTLHNDIDGLKSNKIIQEQKTHM